MATLILALENGNQPKYIVCVIKGFVQDFHHSEYVTNYQIRQSEIHTHYHTNSNTMIHISFGLGKTVNERIKKSFHVSDLMVLSEILLFFFSNINLI